MGSGENHSLFISGYQLCCAAMMRINKTRSSEGKENQAAAPPHGVAVAVAVGIGLPVGGVVAPDGGSIIDAAVSAPSSRPAMPALVSVDMMPVRNALKATVPMSRLRPGAICVIRPTCVPSEPRLPKPQML